MLDTTGAEVDGGGARPELPVELPVDLPVEAANPPASCACAQAVVHCRGGGAMYARTDRTTCTFEFPRAMCAAFGLTDGATVDPEGLLATVPSAALRADDVFDFCGGKHEAAHACDDVSVSSCATEGKAYGVTVACMLEREPSVCAADASDCARLSLYIDASRAAGDLNDCLCTGASCETCTASCVAAHPNVASTCKRAAAAYCPSP